jgi:hypothetical protein
MRGALKALRCKALRRFIAKKRRSWARRIESLAL